MPGRRTPQIGVGREGILRLGHADRQVAIALRLPCLQLIAHRLVGQNLVGMVDPLGDRLDLVEKSHLVGIERGELAALVRKLHDLLRQRLDPFATLGPVLAEDRLGPLRLDELLHRGDLGLGVRDKVVDRHHHRNPKALEVADMPAKVGAALLHRCDILGSEIRLRDPAVHLHRPHGRHQHHRIGGKTRFPALDVHELLGAKIGAEAGFGDHIVRQLQCRCRRGHRIAPMRDIGKGAAMYEGRVVLQRLHQVRLHRALQQNGHRTVCLEVAAIDRRLVAAIGHDHVAEALFQILQVLRQAEDRHDFRRDGDVEPRLAREPVGHTSERAVDLPQSPVVHVNHTPPDDAAGVDFQRVAPVDMIVDHRRQQVVGAGDGVEVPGEMKVHFLHRHHLRHTATCRASLHPEIRAQRRLADADDSLLADPVQTVTKTNGRGRLALARRGRVDRRHQDQLAILVALNRVDETLADLGLVMAVRQQIFRRDPQLGPDLEDRLLLRLAGNFDVTFVGHGA